MESDLRVINRDSTVNSIDSDPIDSAIDYWLARTALNAQSCQYGIQRTDGGEAALKQIQPNETREPQKMLAHEYGAGLYSQ